MVGSDQREIEYTTIIQDPDQYAIEGSQAPDGSLYRPVVMSVDCWARLRPWARHHTRSSVLRVGTRIPRPMNAWAEPMSAMRCSLVSATPCEPYPNPVA